MRTLGLPPPASLAVHRGVSDTGATVAIRGLASPFSILHVSDSHIDGGPEPGREAEAEFMRGVNSQGLPDMSARGDISSAADKLWTQLQTGAQAGARLVAHTGDLVNFPSRKAVALVQGIIDDSGIAEFLFISGNHDWAYSAGGGTGQLAGSSGPWVTQDEVGLSGLEAMRAGEIGGALAPLFGGRHGTAWAHDVGGLRFVGVDNSHYQVDATQHAVLLDALRLEPRARGTQPPVVGVVLMVHVPLFCETLVASMAAGGRDCGDSVCGNPSGTNPPLPSTAAFIETVRGASNLVCVLSGHLHSAQAQKLSGEWRADRPGDRTPLPCHGCLQYVVDGGCYGGYRLLSFVPLEADAAPRL